MNKLIKEILTNKAVRDYSVLAVFIATTISAGDPWTS